MRRRKEGGRKILLFGIFELLKREREKERMRERDSDELE